MFAWSLGSIPVATGTGFTIVGNAEFGKSRLYHADWTLKVLFISLFELS